MTNDILESIKNYCKIINKRRLIKSAKKRDETFNNEK